MCAVSDLYAAEGAQERAAMLTATMIDDMQRFGMCKTLGKESR